MIIKTFFIALILLLISPHIALTKNCGDFKNAQYLRNYDGDTITFNIAEIQPYIGKKICCVQVAGIYTPEINGKCDKEKKLAKKAKSVVRDLMRNASRIVLKDVMRGRFDKVSATILADGIDISNVLVDQGLAARHDGEMKTWNWCK
jgi:micrococcal nuclease